MATDPTDRPPRNLTREVMEDACQFDAEGVRNRVLWANQGRFESAIREGLEGSPPCSECGRKGPERWAVRIYADMAGWLGAKTLVAINLWQKIGARDESEARELVQTALSAKNTDPDVLALTARRFLDEYRRERKLPPLIEAGARIEVNSTHAEVSE